MTSFPASFEILSRRTLEQGLGEPRRGLYAGQFAGWLTEAVVKEVVACTRSPIDDWAHCAPLLLVADLCQFTGQLTEAVVEEVAACIRSPIGIGAHRAPLSS